MNFEFSSTDLIMSDQIDEQVKWKVSGFDLKTATKQVKWKVSGFDLKTATRWLDERWWLDGDLNCFKREVHT